MPHHNQAETVIRYSLLKSCIPHQLKSILPISLYFYIFVEKEHSQVAMEYILPLMMLTVGVQLFGSFNKSWCPHQVLNWPPTDSLMCFAAINFEIQERQIKWFLEATQKVAPLLSTSFEVARLRIVFHRYLCTLQIKYPFKIVFFFAKKYLNDQFRFEIAARTLVYTQPSCYIALWAAKPKENLFPRYSCFSRVTCKSTWSQNPHRPGLNMIHLLVWPWAQFHQYNILMMIMMTQSSEIIS